MTPLLLRYILLQQMSTSLVFVRITLTTALLSIIFLSACDSSEGELASQQRTSDTYLTEEALVSALEDRSITHEIETQIITVPPDIQDPMELVIYRYDFERLDEAHERISHLDTRKALQFLFQHITRDIPEENHELKWLAVSDFLSMTLKYSPLTQLMYQDETMVTHPLVLLYLGDAQCGHMARVVVDLALANGYEARLVQLAAHVVAEVKWNNAWHFIDAYLDFPLDDIKRVFPDGIPSLRELAEYHPYDIDKLAARTGKRDFRVIRTMTAFIKPQVLFYPSSLTTASAYFGEQIFKHLYTGDANNPREGLEYYYKRGTYPQWENDKYYGWHNYTYEVDIIPMIPIEFLPPRITIIAPSVVYKKDTDVVIPISFFRPERISIKGNDVFNVIPIDEKIEYEIRVSTQTRGWDYDFPNYMYMPSYGKGDIEDIIISDKTNSNLIEVELYLDNLTGDFFCRSDS